MRASNLMNGILNVDKLPYQGVIQQRSMSYLINGANRRWLDGEVPYEIDSNFAPWQINLVETARDMINLSTNAHLRPRGGATDYVMFTSGTGCSTPVGRQGGQQNISCNLASGNFNALSVAHEIMHALGFYHEQSRSDRNNHIQIQYANINSADHHNFDIRNGTPIGPYDFDSIMHYRPTAFSNNGLPTIICAPGNTCPPFGNANGLSLLDARGVNLTYNGFVIGRDWTSGAFYGDYTTAFADVTGNNKADAIAVNRSGIYVSPSNGIEFTPAVQWCSAFYGSKGTHFADLTGNGMADAIAVNDSGIYVKLSTGSRFTNTNQWCNAFHGSKGTYFADVTGDGNADAIAVNHNGIFVRTSNGRDGFNNATQWSSTFYGNKGTYFADLTGNGRADAIAVNDDGIYVKPSTGSGFTNSHKWCDAFYGSKGTFFADVTGDGKADVIAVNSNSSTVRPSESHRFGGDINGTSKGFFGSRGTFFANVTNDRRAALIAVNDHAVSVRPSGVTL